MKQTMRSYNSTLRPRSEKRAAQEKNYREILAKIIWRKNAHDLDRSEWDGTFGRLIEAHHIDGRRGDRLCDPFNIILLTPAQHRTFQAHNSWEVRQALKAWVYELRIQQGFKDE